jgi:DNA-directed RNA polymerase specialized sigma24 family protein
MGVTISGSSDVDAADASDAELVARTDRGDGEAFAELFRRHAHPAWRAALAVGGSTATAEQAVTEAFTAALSHDGLGPGRPLPVSLRVVRAAVAAASAEVASGVGAAADEPPNAAIAALWRLPARSRAVVWLVAVEGGSPAQVAPLVGLDPDEVDSLADRALHALRAQAPGLLGRGAKIRRVLAPLVVPMPAELAASAATWWRAWNKQPDIDLTSRRRWFSRQ